MGGTALKTENASIRPFAALLTQRAQTQDGGPDYKKLYEAAKRKSAAERSRADFWKGQYLKLRERLGPQQQPPVPPREPPRRPTPRWRRPRPRGRSPVVPRLSFTGPVRQTRRSPFTSGLLPALQPSAADRLYKCKINFFVLRHCKFRLPFSIEGNEGAVEGGSPAQLGINPGCRLLRIHGVYEFCLWSWLFVLAQDAAAADSVRRFMFES
ncbi:hypothetical protein HNY73_008113 [Argiope bruennichi]|uniref:Uncharacterized protein n=1 Tax=Argiope bruennichi TaxID=94029 RepID=A0A8T0F7M2_ARGBR|nr:hypothetical protein HNY73_008113 [Argiope bruennichi]